MPLTSQVASLALAAKYLYWYRHGPGRTSSRGLRISGANICKITKEAKRYTNALPTLPGVTNS